MKKELSHYYPYQQSDISLIKRLNSLLSDMYRFRGLMWQLTSRDLFSVYKRSVFGFLWLFLTPLFQIITWVLLQKTNILNPGELSVPYPVFVLMGTLIWGLFIGILNSSMTVFPRSRMMMMRIKLPFEIFFVVQILVKLIPFIISMVILIPILFLFKVPLSINLLILPIAIIPVISLALGLGMLFSTFTSLSYDLKRVVSSFFNLAMFFTPVVYSADKLSEGNFRAIVLHNPISHLLDFSRSILFNEQIILSKALLFSSLFSILILFLGWRLLSLTSNRLLERIY